MLGRINELTPRDARLFACDCAYRVLHIYERTYPDDHRPRHAVETSRRYAYGQATLGELDTAHGVALASWAARDTRDVAAAWVAWSTKGAVWDAAGWAAWAAAGCAALSTANAANAARAAAKDTDAAEREWQESRLRWYLMPNRGPDWLAFGRGRMESDND